MNLICEKNDLNQNIPKISAGTLIVQVPCSCELHQGNEILITQLHPCDSKDEIKIDIINLIPVTWSKLKSIRLFPIESGVRHEFKNLTEILNTNWTISNPTFKVTNLKKIEHVKLKNNEFDIFTDTKFLIYILAIWSLILSIIILILAYCVHIQNIKVKLLLPKRDYNSRNESSSQ